MLMGVDGGFDGFEVIIIIVRFLRIMEILVEDFSGL